MNRLHEIRLNSTITEWNYVPGSENPADMCTRYTPLQQLHPESLWIIGPSPLYQNNTKASLRMKFIIYLMNSTTQNHHV